MEEVAVWVSYKGVRFMVPSPKPWLEVLEICSKRFNSSTKDIGGPELPMVGIEREKPRRSKKSS